MFTDEFLDGLPDDPFEALEAMCSQYMLWKNNEANQNVFLRYNEFVEAYSAAEAFIRAHDLPYDLIELGVSKQSNIKQIQPFFENLDQKLKSRQVADHIETTRMKYARRFGAGFWYEFSDGDLNRIQQLINELRDTITASELFDEKHKQRILRRLEKLQAELHKKMGSLDLLWGMMGDLGIVLGKFGRDAKPLVDRIGEIVKIGWRAQIRAEELASGLPFPLLPDGEEKKEED